MVAKFFINGGNTDTDLNWSLSQSGPNDTVKPTISDDANFLDVLVGTVDAVMNCKDLTFANNSTLNVNNAINVDGDYSKSSGGNVNSGANIIVKGNVSILSNNNHATVEMIGDDKLLTCPASLSVVGQFLLNLNVGKKLTISNTINLSSFFADWTIQEGILDLGAFNLSGKGDMTQNGGSVTSSSGILTQERFFLNDGTFDPFKAISSTGSNSTLFTDSATLNLMPSGGEVEFIGSNHWSINQLFTEFPVLRLNKCPSCGQGGQWYAQDVHNDNSNKIGTGFIRGDLYGSGLLNPSGTQTFDGTGVQVVYGLNGFHRLVFNKISGSLSFQDDFYLQECEVITGADLVDFGTTTGRIFGTGSHLGAADWKVLGLNFYNLELEIATTGTATMNTTTVLKDFDIIQCQTLTGSITLGGDLNVLDSTVGSGFDLIMNGNIDQYIFLAVPSASGINVTVIVNKQSGIVRQLSNVGGNTLDVTILKGAWCTNEFDFEADDLIIVDSQSEFQKTTNSNVTYNTLIGTVTNTDSCKKKTKFFVGA